MEKELKQAHSFLINEKSSTEIGLKVLQPEMRLVEPICRSPGVLRRISVRTKKLCKAEPISVFEPRDPCWFDGSMAFADDIRNVDNYFEYIRALDPDFGTGIPSYVSVRFVDELVGCGVYANRVIEKGEFIGFYTGEWKLDEESGSDYIFEPLDDSNIFIDAESCGNFTRYINHAYSKKSNLEAIIYLKKDQSLHLPLVIYYAKKRIEKDQQLLINYGRQYWNQMGLKPL
jgi:hypothetical protein